MAHDPHDPHLDAATGMVPLSEDDLDNDPNTPSKRPLWERLLGLFLTMAVFVVALELMGDGIKAIGQGSFDLEGFLRTATGSPLLGLITGILVTSLVQSSSTTTSLVVTLVATGTLPVPAAIPVIMGANIGTTVTNTIVSMGHITRPQEFKLAIAGATVHDFFNWMAVLILLPLEILFGVISTPALAIAEAIPGVDSGGLGKTPFDQLAKFLFESVFAENGWITAAIGLTLLFIALRYLVVFLKSLVLGRSEGALDRYVFGNPMVAMLFGMVLTFMVQSSSVTTSLVIPLIGAGVLTVRKVFPYMLGANVGTTATGMFAAAIAITSGEPAAVAGLEIAICHTLFNVFGIILIYPIPFIREIPIRMAEFVGELAFKNRLYAVAYVAGLFYILPVILELIF
ncbi:MAG: phosphate transporter [Rhodothermaceae bacterium]|uniref:Na/Pi symporter n=1 Tax=Rubrivirga sp. SAORIC476 TaxID=1961794 RepID=UPI000BA8E6AC|nr:Na/Pi symporter [Rubrivirga sp. SAORIC476]MAQ95356.1 phosphate transporter [Rhodothermaceae bacterium]MBC13431.1 phosphate transporter [Rhodothermaceae bacterium]